MNRIDRPLAQIAYWLACISPFSLIWILLVSPEWSHRKGFFAQVVIWSPSCTAAAAMILGVFCLVYSYIRVGHIQHSNYAKAAMALGTISAVGISLVAPEFLAPKPNNYDARRACLSNVKQIDIGLMMYVQDYDERWPRGAHWTDDLAPYVKNDKVFHCPAEDNQSEPSYGFNQALSGVELARIEDPARTVDLIDAKPGKNRVVGVHDYPFTTRHDPFLIAGYTDGHAKWMDSAKILEQVWTFMAPPAK